MWEPEIVWSRQDHIEFCMINAEEEWVGSMHEYRRTLEEMTDAELDAESDWIFELTCK